MVDRVRSKQTGGGNYFAAPKSDLQFIQSGCKTLDCALGGGWAEGRIFNVVGDKSTGKTLLMIEAAANFVAKYPGGRVRYREAEAAFDDKYAGALGMPMGNVDFGEKPMETIEDLFEDLGNVVEKAKEPELYILDSLDALSDRAEMGRDMDEGTYGTEKARKMSQLFRRLTQKMSKSHVTLGIVSQVRSKIGVQIGRHTTRSGGRALDFYCSQVLFLSQLGKEYRTVQGVKRPTGVRIRAICDKNKISLPFRESEFEILFGFGIDDFQSCVDFLKETKALDMIEIAAAPAAITAYIKEVNRYSDSDYQKELRIIRKAVEKRWYEIERSFIPNRKKYGG